MKQMPLFLLIAFIFVLSTVAVDAEANAYSRTKNIFRSSPNISKFFKNSYGYAIFPVIGKAGYVVGGSYGKGRVYRGGKLTGKTSVIEGSIGFQVGGEAFSEIIFFQDKRAYDEFTSGNFEFGATAQAVAVTAGVNARAGTAGTSAGASSGPRTGVQAETDYVNGMATFVHTKGGFMYEFSIGGQKFNFQPM
ncbi:MAG: lipid-binding SYLF domain-containing protein [Pseudomonadota bacterium]